jgi:hypothetical protein
LAHDFFHASKQLLGPFSLEFSFGLGLVALAKGNVRSKQGRFLNIPGMKTIRWAASKKLAAFFYASFTLRRML